MHINHMESKRKYYDYLMLNFQHLIGKRLHIENNMFDAESFINKSLSMIFYEADKYINFVDFNDVDIDTLTRLEYLFKNDAIIRNYMTIEHENRIKSMSYYDNDLGNLATTMNNLNNELNALVSYPCFSYLLQLPDENNNRYSVSSIMVLNMVEMFNLGIRIKPISPTINVDDITFVDKTLKLNKVKEYCQLIESLNGDLDDILSDKYIESLNELRIMMIKTYESHKSKYGDSLTELRTNLTNHIRHCSIEHFNKYENEIRKIYNKYSNYDYVVLEKILGGNLTTKVNIFISCYGEIIKSK